MSSSIEGRPWYPLPRCLLMEPHLLRRRASGPCTGHDEHHGWRAAAPSSGHHHMAVHRRQISFCTPPPCCGQCTLAAPSVRYPTVVGSEQWCLLLLTTTLPWTVGSGGSLCTPPCCCCGQWEVAAPSVHCPIVVGKGWWAVCLLVYTAAPQGAVGKGSHPAHGCTAGAVGRGPPSLPRCTEGVQEAGGSGSPSTARCTAGGCGQWAPFSTLPHCRGQWATGLLQYTPQCRGQWTVGILQSHGPERGPTTGTSQYGALLPGRVLPG